MSQANGRTRRNTPAEYQDFAHTGPGTLAGRFLRRFWQPVSRSEDLPVGRAKPIRVMGEEFTLYRGQDGGVPHVLAHRCAHRGTQLSTGWVEGDTLRCFYHGWRYGPDGRCLEQPAEAKPFCEKVRIDAYPTEEYLGLVFAYLGEGEPPSLPRLPEFEEQGVLLVSTYRWPCNYFNSVENSCDPSHVAFVHRESTLADGGIVGIPLIEAKETEYGIAMRSKRPNETVRVTHLRMPTSQSIKQPPLDPAEKGWSDYVSWRVPVDAVSFNSYSANLVHVAPEDVEPYQERRRARQQQVKPPPDAAEAVLRGELSVADVLAYPNVVNIQDYVAQVGQGAIAPRERDRLGRSDVAVILLRKIWSRELRALAQSTPLKEWRWETRLTATSGTQR